MGEYLLVFFKGTDICASVQTMIRFLSCGDWDAGIFNGIFCLFTATTSNKFAPLLSLLTVKVSN